jgi:hypothetical protein
MEFSKKKNHAGCMTEELRLWWAINTCPHFDERRYEWLMAEGERQRHRSRYKV